MSEPEKLVFRVVIRGSREAVWRELTKTDELQKAFFNMRMSVDRLEPGGRLRMVTGSGKFTAVVGDVLEYDPPNRFVYTLRFTAYDDPPCTVINELRDTPDGVEYTLIVEGIVPGTKTARDMKSGGRMIVNTLRSVVETGRPPLGIRLMHGMFRLLEPTTPARCRSEKWTD